MKTYNELKAKLIEVGFKDIEGNYCGGGACRMHVGYGRGNNPWPHWQIRILHRRRETLDGKGFYFEDIIQGPVGGGQRVTSLEQIWKIAMDMIPLALAPNALT